MTFSALLLCVSNLKAVASKIYLAWADTVVTEFQNKKDICRSSF